jgi:hypothetical protein
VLRGLLILTLAIGLTAGARRVESPLDARALAEAIDIGQSRIASVPARFHQPYRRIVNRPPVDYIDIITPFRRIVLAAETRARAGERSFTQREALATLASGPRQIDLVVELSFHPQNTYIGVPEYQVRLLAAGPAGVPALDPIAVQRMPRFGPRLEGAPLPYPFPLAIPAAPGSLPPTGGTLIASLDGDLVGQGAYDVLVVEAGNELARARVEFGTLR